MITPAVSFETILAAMMCLCSSEDNTTRNMYEVDGIPELFQRSLGKDAPIGEEPRMMVEKMLPPVFVKDEVSQLKDKISSLERSFAVVEDLQNSILKVLNISPESDLLVAEGSATSCPAQKQISNIKVPKFPQPFIALCNGNGWLVIQQRYDGSENFFRKWVDYELGFGTMYGEFFIGLEKLNAITSSEKHELRIELEDFDQDKRFAHYEEFEIGTAHEGYPLKVLGKYDGTAGDSLRRHVSHKFTTYDRDNDIYAGNCAVDYNGAWWYDECETSNLNGLYLNGKLPDDKFGKGMSWDTFRGLGYSLKSVKMMIRPNRM